MAKHQTTQTLLKLQFRTTSRFPDGWQAHRFKSLRPLWITRLETTVLLDGMEEGGGRKTVPNSIANMSCQIFMVIPTFPPTPWRPCSYCAIIRKVCVLEPEFQGLGDRASRHLNRTSTRRTKGGGRSPSFSALWNFSASCNLARKISEGCQPRTGGFRLSLFAKCSYS